jgi:hypothetical protein
MQEGCQVFNDWKLRAENWMPVLDRRWLEATLVRSQSEILGWNVCNVFFLFSENLFTPNIIANVRHACLDECAVRAKRQKLKVLTTATLAARNANEALVARMVGSGGVCVWRESGVRRSVLCWCVWQESGFSRREDVSTINLLYKEIYKLCTFSAVCKNNAAINCITVQHEKSSFPSPLMGHTTLVKVQSCSTLMRYCGNHCRPDSRLSTHGPMCVFNYFLFLLLQDSRRIHKDPVTQMIQCASVEYSTPWW